MAGRDYPGQALAEALKTAIEAKSTASGVAATCYINQIPADTTPPYYRVGAVNFAPRDNKTSWLTELSVDVSGWSHYPAQSVINQMVEDVTEALTDPQWLSVAGFNCFYSNIGTGTVIPPDDNNRNVDEAEQSLWRLIVTGDFKITGAKR